MRVEGPCCALMVQISDANCSKVSFTLLLVFALASKNTMSCSSAYLWRGERERETEGERGTEKLTEGWEGEKEIRREEEINN